MYKYIYIYSYSELDADIYFSVYVEWTVASPMLRIAAQV